ncbi:MAG: phosphotyrosine protein phosphatase [Verrucomicrobia bacterium]|nr:phosphotyrosine protein phosphatase [Verrucomicrobiota bacterium]
MSGKGLKVLFFVCSRNQWRSPTAEKIYRNNVLIHVRSAGTSSKARKRVSVKDIEWCDFILVMKKKHKQRLIADFSEAVRHRPLHVLEIEDNYSFMDSELVQDLRLAIEPILEDYL